MTTFLSRQNHRNTKGNISFPSRKNHKSSRIVLTATFACVLVLALMYVAAPAAEPETTLVERQQQIHRQERRQSIDLKQSPSADDSSTKASSSVFAATEPAKVTPIIPPKNDLRVVAFDSASSQLSEMPQFSTIECNIDQFYHPDNNAKGAGSERPTILHGYWDTPSMDHWKKESSYLEALGNIPYYIKDKYVQIRNDQCVAKFEDLWKYITSGQNKRSLLAFTNDKENPALFEEKSDLMEHHIPEEIQHIDSFAVLSTMTNGQSHEFHKHGESWIGQTAGHKVWWFLPPTESKAPEKVNACDYLTGKQKVPAGATTCLQSPGDIIWFPKDWYHATCSLTDWTVGIGKQLGPRINQKFPTLDLARAGQSPEDVKKKLDECSGQTKESPKSATTDATDKNKNNTDAWKWYDGDMNKYYNDLEKDHKRNPNDINAYAVHRWMGPKRSTQIHYELIHESIQRRMKATFDNNTVEGLNVLDAGCGLGSALMWMEKKEPSWKLTGRTLSEGQLEFINNDLPKHNFDVQLGSFDDLDEGATYDAIYSIEAMIHSYDIVKTLTAWSRHLHPEHGILVVIDDFLARGADKNDPEVDLFARSWLANSLYTVSELDNIARKVGLELVESRDILTEFRVIELNYQNRIPNLSPQGNRNHQGWMGSKYRQKLTVEGKLGYNLVTFQKIRSEAAGK